MEKVELGKQYTLQGIEGTVRYIEGALDEFSVLFESKNGSFYICDAYGKEAYQLFASEDSKIHGHALIKVDDSISYSEIPIDTFGWGKAECFDNWHPCHFAGVVKGKPTGWSGGKTSKTAHPAMYVVCSAFTTVDPFQD